MSRNLANAAYACNVVQRLTERMTHAAFLSNSSISALSFTFPTNGVSTFTVRVPAILNGPIQGQGDFPNFSSFQLNMPQTGHLVLTFNFFPASGGVPANYEFSQGNFVATTTPEPGTLGFMVTGLAGIIGVIRRKRTQVPRRLA
jgi:PEP-CTERM motif-containing protein